MSAGEHPYGKYWRSCPCGRDFEVWSEPENTPADIVCEDCDRMGWTRESWAKADKLRAEKHRLTRELAEVERKLRELK